MMKKKKCKSCTSKLNSHWQISASSSIFTKRTSVQ